MTYIEFYDNDAIKNILSCLSAKPDKVIFVGYNTRQLKKQTEIYREFFMNRWMDIDFQYLKINKNDLSDCVEKLGEIIENNDDCHFDITGGDDNLLNVDLNDGIVYSEDVMQKKYYSAMSYLCDRLHYLAAPCIRYDSSLKTEKDEHLTTGDLTDSEKSDFNESEPKVKNKTFWGFNPVLPKKYPDLAAKLGISVALQQNEAYNIDELNCYRGVYGIMAKYIPKLVETPDSEYYKNYETVINRITSKVMEGKDEALVETPHIDKTWHYVLPYVTPEKQREAEKEFYKFFWMALAYSYLTLNNEGHFQTTIRKKKDTGGEYTDTELILYQNRTIDLRRIGNLIKALHLDPKFVFDTRKTLANYLEMDRRLDRDQYDNLALISGTERIRFNEGQKIKYNEGGLASTGFSNAVTIITKYSKQPDSEAGVIATLIDSLYDLIRDVLSDDFADYEA